MTQPPVLALWCCPPNKYTYIPSIRNTWEVQIISIKLEIRDSNILRMSDAVSRYGFPQLVGQKHWWITMQKSAFLSQKKGASGPGTPKDGWDRQHCSAAHVPVLQHTEGSVDMLPLNNSLSLFQVTHARTYGWNRDPGPVIHGSPLKVTSAHSLGNCCFFKEQ